MPSWQPHEPKWSSFLRDPLDRHYHQSFYCVNADLRWSGGRDCRPAARWGEVARVVVDLAIHGGDGCSRHIQACMVHASDESVALQRPYAALQRMVEHAACACFKNITHFSGSCRLIPGACACPACPYAVWGRLQTRELCLGGRGAPWECTPWARSRFWRSCGLMAARRATCPCTAARLAAEGWMVTV